MRDRAGAPHHSTGPHCTQSKHHTGPGHMSDAPNTKHIVINSYISICCPFRQMLLNSETWSERNKFVVSFSENGVRQMLLINLISETKPFL